MRHRRITTSAVTAGLIAGVASLAVSPFLDAELRAAGRPDLVQMTPDVLPYLLGFLSSITVGAALALRMPRHPAGWLFLALGDLIALNAFATGYASYGALARPGSLPGAAILAVESNTDWTLWLTVLSLILQLTPTGRPLSPRWRAVAVTTAACGVAAYLLGMFRNKVLDPPFETVANPIGLPHLNVLMPFLLIGLLGGTLLAGVSLAVRFRRARGLARRRLLWLAPVAFLFPALVAVTVYASRTDNYPIQRLAGGAFLLIVPLTAGLSVSRYRLDVVDRVLSRTATYVLMSGLLAFTYLSCLYTAALMVGGGRSRSVDIVATLAAVVVAAPAYRYVQNAVDRRFNRRRFDALHVVRSFVRDPRPDLSIQDVLRSALADPGLQVAYRIDSRDQWVSGGGLPAETTPDDVEVSRHGRPVARIAFDAEVADRALVRAVAAEATPELENAALRADVAQRLVEVRESRARLSEAQVTERRKIERDLHDGAQQRLLALALQLRAALGAGDADRLFATVENGIEELRSAVGELRELANGLHPAALSTGGLLAALDELAARTPVPIAIDCPDQRYPPPVEATAWFVACEAVTNAVKHADPTGIQITLSRRAGELVVDVTDDGHGGADADGRGLRGIADRAEAAGGTLTVRTGPAGTTIRSELPCAW